jgi:hypothetical protein
VNHLPLARPGRYRRALAAVTATVVVGAVAVAAAPAATSAETFSVGVAPTTDLDPAGDTVTVTLNNLPADQGVYVRLCVQPQPGTRPASATCDGQGVWVVENFPYGPTPTDGSVVKPSAGPVTIPVRAAFGDIDCLTTTCGVFTRRDHPAGATDLTLDTFTALTFDDGEPEPEPEPTEPPTTFGVTVTPTTGVDAGDDVQVELTGIPSGQGVYARWCAKPAEGLRPSADQCDGQGVWALEAYPYGPRPTDGTVVDPSAGAFALSTTAAIGAVDCTEAICGVSIRRDHRGSADTALDAFVPVTLNTSTEEPGEGPGTDPETQEPGGGEGEEPGTETPTKGQASLSVDDVVPGDEVTVTGDGFTPGETVEGTLFSDPVDLGSASADDEGNGALTFTVPEVESGTHTVQLEGSESGRVVTATLTVSAEAAEQEPVAAALPQTGGAVDTVVPWALALLLIGGWLTATTRGAANATAKARS